MKMELKKKIVWLTIFSIAMGFMETVIVVYLRKLYYPNGFNFPLVEMDLDILKAEFLREAATIVMLFAIGILTGKTAAEKFAYFIFCFAIWDLFYYVFLKVLLDWPESLFTWDILFLIPLPWIGPVLAPCIVSLTMIVLAMGIVCLQENGRAVVIQKSDWALFSLGSIIVIFSFMINLFQNDTHSPTLVTSGINAPAEYNWLLVWMGEAIIIMCMIKFFKKNRNEHRLEVLSKQAA